MPSRSMVAERRPGSPLHGCIIHVRRGPRSRCATDMQPARIAVDVIMEREQLHNRWATERWQAHAVAPAGATNAAPIERLPGGGHERWRFSRLPVDLHPSESEGYYLNLTSGAPVWFVMWRVDDEDASRAWPEAVSLSYNEAGRWLDAQERVDNVPLPAELRDWLQAYTDAHYRPEPKQRRRPQSFLPPQDRR